MMKKLLKVVYKAPNENPVVKEIEDSLKGMKEAVQGLIACTAIKEQLDLWYNDEFLFHDFKPNFVLDSTIIHGPVFFAGVDEMGNSTSLTAEEINYVMSRFIGSDLIPIPGFFNLPDSELYILKAFMTEMDSVVMDGVSND